MSDLQFYDDPAAFLRDAATLLAADPVMTTVLSSVTHRVAAADLRGEPRAAHPHWWLAVREGGRVVGVAMRTAPFGPDPLYLLPMPEAAALSRPAAVGSRRRGRASSPTRWPDASTTDWCGSGRTGPSVWST